MTEPILECWPDILHIPYRKAKPLIEQDRDSQPAVGPKRIQRKRKKGWRMPPNAVYVGRPSRWGNPVQHKDPAVAVRQFLKICKALPPLRAQIRRELAGKDLACWCPLDQPCHADVLIELANPPLAGMQGEA